VLGGFLLAAWFVLLTREEHRVALQSFRRLRRLA
jgi:hypothetical protein